MEVDCCLPGTVDSELLDPRQDPPLPDLPNLLTVPPGSHGSGIRHRQERLFCAVCQQFLEEPCWFHAKSVPNESVVPFALASLPKILQLDVCANSSTGKKVIANARIPPQTVFGPLVAPLAEKCGDSYVYAFPSADDGQLRFFQLDSELFSNWMRYVRFAENPAEENLAVYLRGSQIVFVSVRTILPGEELKVCYSAKYAQFIGRSDGQSGRAGNESFCMTALEFAEHSENILPQNPPQTRNGAADWDSDASRTLLTEKDGSALPALQAFPYALLITPLTVHNFDEGYSVTPPSKRRCLADTTATVASPLASQESADSQMNDYANASPPPLTGSGSLPSVKTTVIREDSPEIEYHSIVKTPSEWRSKEEPKAGTETVPRKSTLRSAAKKVAPAVMDTCQGNQGVLTGRFHVDTDSDWSPENDETCDRNESVGDDCDMSVEQNSGRIKKKPIRIAKSGRAAPFRSNGPPDGNGGCRSGNGVTGGESCQSRAPRKRGTNRKEECPVCHRDVFKLNAHLKRKHPEYAAENLKYACETCGMRYRSMQVLRTHMSSYHPTPRGAELTAEARELAVEYMQKTGWLSYFCASCNKYFLDKSLLDIHGLSHRVLEDHQSRPERNCPVCAFTGTRFAELAVHTADHAIDPRERKQCLLCPDQVFVLVNHYKKNHPEYREIISKDWQFVCQQCGIKCHSKHRLDRHLRAHDKRFSCIYCAQQFETPVAQGQHNLSHQKDGVFPCPLCPRTYPLYKSFQSHYHANHVLKGVFVCEICQVTFRHRDRLNAHMQLHREIRSRKTDGSLALQADNASVDTVEALCDGSAKESE